jgi:hypothetical protein
VLQFFARLAERQRPHTDTDSECRITEGRENA